MDSLDVLGMVCSFGSEPGEVVQAVVMSSMSRVIAGQDAVGGAVAVAPVNAAARRKRQAVEGLVAPVWPSEVCCPVSVLADSRGDVPALGGEPLDAELAETAGSAVMTMARGTLASSVEVTSRPTLGPPSPRPNPQKLLVLARDL
jgi:hypothetical protein